jgi:uncharacterized protein
MKLVVVLLAVLLLVWLLLGSSRRRAKDARRDAPAAQPPSSVEGMVACAHCGVHLPGSLAVLARGQAYCSAAHRDAGPRAP